jgi:hypothetical protein
MRRSLEHANLVWCNPFSGFSTTGPSARDSGAPDGHLLCVADELVAETEKIPSSIIGRQVDAHRWWTQHLWSYPLALAGRLALITRVNN